MIALIVLNIALIVLILVIELPKFNKKPENTPRLTKEEKKKIELAKESFENLMKYDEKQAMRKE
jgi:hypothetical protein